MIFLVYTDFMNLIGVEMILFVKETVESSI